MILVIDPQATLADVEHLLNRLNWMGLKASRTEQAGVTNISVAAGSDQTVNFAEFVQLPFVQKIMPLTQPYKLAARELKGERTCITVRGRIIGGKALCIIAGPCSVESEENLREIAQHAKAHGAHFLRGGAFKPRTSPYSFQGLGERGLQYLQRVGQEFDLVTVSEVMDGDQIDLVAQYCDMLQIGARNMQNFSLLKKLGRVSNPILLKRGLSATYQDLLMSAEYILNAGNPNVILCERGIRTFETYSRNTLDLNAVPILKELSHLPVIVDPSHGTGIRSLVAPMARAAIAAGADGIMVEIHPHPEKALSDAEQTLSHQQFTQVMSELKQLAPIVHRTMS